MENDREIVINVKFGVRRTVNRTGPRLLEVIRGALTRVQLLRRLLSTWKYCRAAPRVSLLAVILMETNRTVAILNASCEQPCRGPSPRPSPPHVNDKTANGTINARALRSIK